MLVSGRLAGRDYGAVKKKHDFLFFFLFHWLFTVTKLNTGDRRISAVKIPVPESLLATAR